MDKCKYCKFHRDHGHDTVDCCDLKDQVESLVEKGYLKEFVGEGAKPGHRRRKYNGNRGNKSQSP